VKQNRALPAALLPTVILPPCASTMDRQMGNPMPIPLTLVVKKLSKNEAEMISVDTRSRMQERCVCAVMAADGTVRLPRLLSLLLLPLHEFLEQRLGFIRRCLGRSSRLILL
jgi:hypothetical protein